MSTQNIHIYVSGKFCVFLTTRNTLSFFSSVVNSKNRFLLIKGSKRKNRSVLLHKKQKKRQRTQSLSLIFLLLIFILMYSIQNSSQGQFTRSFYTVICLCHRFRRSYAYRKHVRSIDCINTRFSIFNSHTL